MEWPIMSHDIIVRLYLTLTSTLMMPCGVIWSFQNLQFAPIISDGEHPQIDDWPTTFGN